MAQRILAIDIGTSGVRLAEFSPLKGGGLQLSNYGARSLNLDPIQEESRNRFVAASIKDLMSEVGIKPGLAIIAVAGQSVFSRYVKLPPVSADKIEKVVEYEARDNVPFAMDEVVWDYQLIPSASGDFDCLLVAIKEDMITEVATSVSETGIEVDLVDVAPMAIFNAFKHNYPNHEGCTLILDMGSRSTDLIFIEGDRLYNRSIPVAGNAVTQQISRELGISFEEAEQIKLENAMVSFGGNYETPGNEIQQMVAKCTRGVMTRMHAEIMRSINFYRGQQSGNPPERVLLTGGSSIVPYTDTFLHEKLKIPVEYLNPLKNVVVSNKVDEEQISRDLHQLSEVVGLGLRKAGSCPIELDLMPSEFAEAKDFRKKQPIVLLALVLLLLAVGAWCFHFFNKDKFAKQELARVDQKLSQLKGDNGTLKVQQQASAELVADLEAINAVAHRRGHWARISDAIRGSIPASLYLTTVEPVSDLIDPRSGREEVARSERDPEATEESGPKMDKIRLVGLGFNDLVANRGGASITEFRDALRKQAVFKTVEVAQQTPFVNPESDGSIYFTSFEIEAELKEPLTP